MSLSNFLVQLCLFHDMYVFVHFGGQNSNNPQLNNTSSLPAFFSADITFLGQWVNPKNTSCQCLAIYLGGYSVSSPAWLTSLRGSARLRRTWVANLHIIAAVTWSGSPPWPPPSPQPSIPHRRRRRKQWGRARSSQFEFDKTMTTFQYAGPPTSIVELVARSSDVFAI